jgi:hypothetical protein
MTGNIMCTLLACDLGKLLLDSYELLPELCLDRGWFTAGCNTSLNLAFTDSTDSQKVLDHQHDLCHLVVLTQFVHYQIC